MKKNGTCWVQKRGRNDNDGKRNPELRECKNISDREQSIVDWRFHRRRRMVCIGEIWGTGTKDKSECVKGTKMRRRVKIWCEKGRRDCDIGSVGL